jgi:hypothetical protein
MKNLIAILFAFGLAAQTPPMIPMATGGGPVGGATNLTTVGSVPYVSASGTLDQDAGQFVWDATNNRLGIGSNAPISPLHAQGLAFTTFPNNPATLFMSSTDAYAANMGAGILFAGTFQSGTTLNTFAYIGGVKENATSGDSAGKLVFGTRQTGTGAVDMTRMTILSSGNVGIGTTTPAAPLHVSKDQNGQTDIRFDNPNAGTAASVLFDMRNGALGANDRLLFGVTGTGYTSVTGWGDAGVLTTQANISGGLILNANAGEIKFETGANGSANQRMVITNSGSVGIGTTTPGVTLDVAGPIGGPASSGSTQTGVFRVSNTTNNVVMDFGVSPNVSPFPAWIQVTNKSTLSTYLPLALQPNGGNVGIGTATPTVPLEVLGNVRFYSSVANPTIYMGEDTTNATSASIAYNRGTANLDITPRSTYATNLVGKLKFSITNSTGANSALLGANSPATILTAPYTWITVITSDGTTGFMPIWK